MITYFFHLNLQRRYLEKRFFVAEQSTANRAKTWFVTLWKNRRQNSACSGSALLFSWVTTLECFDMWGLCTRDATVLWRYSIYIYIYMLSRRWGVVYIVRVLRSKIQRRSAQNLPKVIVFWKYHVWIFCIFRWLVTRRSCNRKLRKRCTKQAFWNCGGDFAL